MWKWLVFSGHSQAVAWFDPGRNTDAVDQSNLVSNEGRKEKGKERERDLSNDAQFFCFCFFLFIFM